MVLNDIIPKIDKLKHFYLWSLFFFAMAIPFMLLSFLFRIHWIVSVIASCVICIITAGAKELVKDKWMNEGTPEWEDFLFSIATPSLCTFMCILIYTLSLFYEA